MSQLTPTQTELATFNLGGKLPNPLEFVSEGIRGALSYWWLCFSKLFPSVLPIAALLASWQKQGELNDKQIVAILQALSRPEKVGEYKYAADVQRELGRMVAERIRCNRRDAAIAARRKTFGTDESISGSINQIIGGLKSQ